MIKMHAARALNHGLKDHGRDFTVMVLQGLDAWADDVVLVPLLPEPAAGPRDEKLPGQDARQRCRASRSQGSHTLMAAKVSPW
jgi:hypothetical protein